MKETNLLCMDYDLLLSGDVVHPEDLEVLHIPNLYEWGICICVGTAGILDIVEFFQTGHSTVRFHLLD